MSSIALGVVMDAGSFINDFVAGNGGGLFERDFLRINN